MRDVKWLLLAFSAALTFITFISLHGVERFYVEKEQVLVDSKFESGNTFWQVRGGGVTEFSDGWLKITNPPGASHIVSQNIEINASGFYKLEFEAGVNQVVPADQQEWKNANVAIVYRDKQGDRVGSRMLLKLEGSNLPEQYSDKFLLRDVLGSVDIAFRLYESGGEFSIANPVMSRLGETLLYRSIKIAVLVAWLVLLSVLAILMFKKMQIVPLVVVAILGLLALIGVTMPEGIMIAINQKVETLLPQSIMTGSRQLLMHVYGGEKSLYPGAEVSKLGHFLIFICIGLYVGLFVKKVGAVFALACILVFALATEALQLLVDGRTTRFGDLIVDTVGGSIGLVVGIFCVWLFHHGMQRRSPTHREGL